jgi:hypothetical protein
VDQRPSDSAAALESLRAALKELETAAVGYHVRRRLDNPLAEPMDVADASPVPQVIEHPSRWRRMLSRVQRIWRRLRG